MFAITRKEITARVVVIAAILFSALTPSAVLAQPSTAQGREPTQTPSGTPSTEPTPVMDVTETPTLEPTLTPTETTFPTEASETPSPIVTGSATPSPSPTVTATPPRTKGEETPALTLFTDPD